MGACVSVIYRLFFFLMQLGLGVKVRVGILVDVFEWILGINYATLELHRRYKLSTSLAVLGEL